MEASAQPVVFAWEPLSPKGVAAFAQANWRRLLLVQFIFALFAAATVVWFLISCWFPMVQAAIRQLPPQGAIRSGQLAWTGKSPRLLADGRFLAFDVDLNHSGQIRSPADIQVEFGRENLRVYSLLGYMAMPYPKGWIIAFNRSELEPWWNAWNPALLGGVAAGVILALFGSWMALATIYCFPIWLVGFYTDRHLSNLGGWKLAGAALMPGALLLTTAIIFYGLGTLDLVKLGGAFCLHLVAGWIYLFLGLIFLPRQGQSNRSKKNPFAERKI